MKRSFILSLVMLITLIAFAQAPQKMSYQAVIRNSSDQLVTNQAIGIRISILQGSPTGTDVYVETQKPTTNANGLATIEIGGGNVVRGTFAGINWTSGVYFIKTEIDPAGGTNYTITGISQILSVPYALYSRTSGNGTLWSQNSSNIYYNNGKVGIGTSTPEGLLNLYGSSDALNPLLLLTDNGIGYAHLEFKNYALPSKNWALAAMSDESDGLSRMRFYYNNGTTRNTLMTITGSGNVGIGNSSPEGSLHIAANSNTDFPQLLLSEKEGDYARLSFKNTAATSKNWSIAGRPDPTDANSRLNFWYWNGTSGSNIMSVTGTGNVGIGTTTPEATVDVRGTVKIGSSGRVFSEIIEITGTTTASGYFTTVYLPAGYNMENTRVLSLEIKRYADSWYTLGASANSGNQVQCDLYSNYIEIISGDNDLAWHNVPFRILLMKVQ
jgi:hypothetical protein